MIIHIIRLDKFIPSFINFVNNNFNKKNHLFIVLGSKNDIYGKVDSNNIIFITSRIQIFYVLKFMYKAEKIIIHGLWSGKLIYMMFFQPWLLKKSYHVMWGGDFYFPEKQSWIKKQVIKQMGHFATYIKGDYELAQKWYGTKGEYHECFMYTSNLYKEYNVIEKAHNGINIQVGNSADPSNNHIDVLKQLEKYKEEDINIFVPLSYGDVNYANEVISFGKKMFGNKFHPMTEFMPFENYLVFLGEIDIALFAHKRQQAMGNTISLLGLGKKVYMRSDITPWKLFQDIDIKVFDVESISLELFTDNEKEKNKKKIKEYFSEENYLKQLKKLFESK